ncbi:uncharacterized protein EI90DRAFT_3042924 [Cantharellus anzutake]|uniref:uncharacterized protein n=1 Tax=Cantharellus anzutake TaxID=1750568 RepID=UPI0019038786|nr:uncharacterized protein EI90DRAFT_3042924 [Cantharellus anzutake]KAF8337422.1 hypothetical protein EI90DRAFT_3042924 [Cantharellus anzutake]
MPKKPSSVRMESLTPLRRNQAKMKCDARRPVCTPCTKAYAHSIAALAVQGQPFQVPCSYDHDSQDDLGPSRSKSVEPPMVGSVRQSPPVRPSTSNPSDHFTLRSSAWETSSQDSARSGVPYMDNNASTSSLDLHPLRPMGSPGPTYHDHSFDEFLGFLPSTSSLAPQPSPSLVPHFGSPSASRTESPEPLSYFTAPNQGSESRRLGAPRRSSHKCELPSTVGLLQLVHIFFDRVPFATILLHRSRFIASVLDGPLLPTYPCLSLLHAICAIAAVYSRLDPHLQLDRALENHLHFAWMHAGVARHHADHDARTGSGSLDAARAYVVLGWYHWWMVTGAAARLAVPLGLNVSAFISMHNPLDFDPIIPPSQIPQDQERNRVLFWLAFINEKHQQMSTQWASCLDEADIGQELPVPLQYLDLGDIPRGYRQRLFDSDLFTNHPRNLTDPFILHLKAMILTSRVGAFNTRARIRRHSDRNNLAMSGSDSGVVESKIFQSLDSSISAFVGSIPGEFRDAYCSTTFTCTHGLEKCPTCGDRNLRSPVTTNLGHLFELNILPHVATIMLHEPRMDMGASHDDSREKVLHSARLILDSIYNLMRNSLDMSALPGYSLSHWMSTGRVLGRFYVRTLELGYGEEAVVIRTEIEVLSQLMGRIGERIPVAAHSQKALDDIIPKAHAFVNDRRNGTAVRLERHLFGKYGLF